MTALTVAGPGGRLAVTHSGSGPPALLLHGWLGDQADLRPLAAALSADHQVILMDLRGHGASQGPGAGEGPDVGAGPGSFTLDDFADDAAAVIDGLRAAPVLVAGHSMGGAVALTLAGRYPHLVSGVVMVDSPWAVTPPGPELVARAGPLRDSEDEYVARRDRLRDARAALLPGPLAPPAAWPVAAQSYQSLMSWDGPAAVRRCPRPVHAVFADGGWQTVAADLAQFPALGVTHVPGTGHWVQVERPAAVAAVIRAHAALSGADAATRRPASDNSDIAIDSGKVCSLRSAERRSNFSSGYERSSLCPTTRSC